MNGFIKVRIMSAGTYFDCWQHVQDGNVVGYVDTDSNPVTLPQPHEAMVLGNGEPTETPT